MKATIEFEKPESCVVCPLGHGNYVGTGIVCKASKPSKIYKEAYNNQDKRAPFCPLKFVADNNEEANLIKKERRTI